MLARLICRLGGPDAHGETGGLVSNSTPNQAPGGPLWIAFNQMASRRSQRSAEGSFRRLPSA
jgi:hypothetical protein